MSLDLQKYAITKLLIEKDLELFHDLDETYFKSLNFIIFKAIVKAYTDFGEIPSVQELILRERAAELVDTWVKETKDFSINNELLVSELENDAVRGTVIDSLVEKVNEFPNMDAESIVEYLSELQLDCGSIETTSKNIIADAVDISLDEDIVDTVSSGFSREFDEKAGGFANQELIVIGGIRGSGKSIICQNLLNHHYETHKKTVAFFNIEMSRGNIRKRFLSQISGIPYSDIHNNVITENQRVAIEVAKIKYLYEKNDTRQDILSEFLSTKNVAKLSKDIKSCSRNPNKYFIIDESSLSVAKLDYMITTMRRQYDLSMVVVDYINILKDSSNSKEPDWLVQQKKAEYLKEIAKKHDIILVTPYQIHTDGSAKRAKAIEDSVDRSFKFFPEINGESGLKGSLIKVYQSKARDNEEFPFYINMDWTTLKLAEVPEGISFEDEERKGINTA